MGLFNPNYNKPGKGVSKNEPEKKGAALWWELFSRKWRSYVLLNIVYALTCIPAFIIYLVVLSGLMGGETSAENFAISGMLATFMVIFFAGSPFKSGFIYVIRNFVRQEHAWTMSDFFSKTKENLAQSIAAFLIDLFLSCAFVFAISSYFTISETNVWVSILLGIVIVIMVLYAIMQSFTWCMMVTFKLKLSQIYKNSYLLSMATIPVNLISLVIRLVVVALAFLINLVSYIIVVAVLISAVALLEQMLAYPTIKKFMLDKAQGEELTSEEENDKEDIE